MAVLNVKNFPDDVYERLRRHAARQRRSISQEVVVLLSDALDASERLSLRELRGLGRNLWKDIDAEDYVRRERESWG